MIDRWRSDRRRTAREQAVESVDAPTTEEVAVSRQRAERLWEAIDTLPDKLRIVVVLGMTFVRWRSC